LGSVGFFGPLTIRPDLWDQGIAKLLMEPILRCFATWGIRHAGLFTFSQSTKHLYLYQKFGFYPRFLTAILSKSVASSEPVVNWSRLSEGEESEQAATRRNRTALESFAPHWLCVLPLRRRNGSR